MKTYGLATVVFLGGCVAGGGGDDDGGDGGDDDVAHATSELGAGWCREVEVPVLRLPIEDGAPINVEEPFVRVVGSTIQLYFSDRAPSEERDLHVAIWSPFGFVYHGPVGGVNTAIGLEAAPTIDHAGNLYFTDSAMPGMIARGVLSPAGTAVSGVGAILGMPPLVITGNITQGNMDLGVAPAQPFAILSRAAWLSTAGGLPAVADLWYLRRYAPSWVEHVPAETAYFLSALNTPDKREYAPELSSDGLMIFYTQTATSPVPSTAILTASRPNLTSPFGRPRIVVGPTTTSFVEGPTVTPGGDRVFYHRISPGSPTRLFTVERCQ